MIDDNFKKEHFLDKDSMDNYQKTLNEAGSISYRVKSGKLDLDYEAGTLAESYDDLLCVARLLYLAVWNMDQMDNSTSDVGKTNSKIVMPKCFDNFANNYDLTEQQGNDCLDGALEEIYIMYMYGGSIYSELEDYMRSNGDEDFYCKCVNALISGYEVEK